MQDKIASWVIIIITLSIILCAIVYSILWSVYNIPTTQVTITVSHKESISTEGGYSYLVWTKEGETFEIRDSLLHLRYDSSDFYNKLKEGETYCVEVTGVRIHFLSWYRNILGFCGNGEEK